MGILKPITHTHSKLDNITVTNDDDKTFYDDDKTFYTNPMKVNLIKAFPKEQCPKIKTKEICEIQTDKINPWCKWNGTCVNNNTITADELQAIASNMASNIKNNNTNYNIDNLVKLIFKKDEDDKKEGQSFPTWDDFTHSDNIDCGYNNFRKLVVDILIIAIILQQFYQYDYTSSIIIKKKDEIIYTDHEPKITIIYEMVGSEDVTSDYDVTIYSYPPDIRISNITTIFSSAFKNILNKTSGEIFDTNLYTHPVYIFSNSDIEPHTDTPEPLYLNLTEKPSIKKYFLNCGHTDFYNNELVYSNMLYWEIEGFFTEMPEPFIINDTFNISGTRLNSDTINSIWNPISDNYSNLELIGVPTPTPLRTPHSKCIKKTLTTKECKSSQNATIERRSDNDTRPINLLKILYNNINNNINNNEDIITNIKNNYISPMRLSLWYADETYITLSAYFHVIHCCAMPYNSKVAIQTLIKNPESFKNICRVSALENFAFMFHKVNKDPPTFIKKTAKYLARISHACAIIKCLNSQACNLEGILKNGNFSNLGNHNYITNKYKRGSLNETMNSPESGLFTNIFETAYNIKKQKPREILKLIYTHLVDVTEPSSLGYNIEPYMICIKPK